MSKQDITRFWHAVELLQPQAVPKRVKREADGLPYIHDVPFGKSLPWEQGSDLDKQPLKAGRIWSHTLYAHLYDGTKIAKRLEALFGSDQGYREPQRRESALFSLKFDEDGRLLEESFVLSSEVWFLGRVLQGKDWSHGFEEEQAQLREHVHAELTGSTVNAQVLGEITLLVLRTTGTQGFFGAMDEQIHRFRSTPTKKGEALKEDDPLNSFYLSDLADVADSLEKDISSPPLQSYLQRHSEQERLQVDAVSSAEAVIDRLCPDHYSDACWPGDQHRELVHSQQFAVNTLLHELADSGGLRGINGPPGTGKTTLLRDLIAAVVGRRADVLSKLRRASDAFVKGDAKEEFSDAGSPGKCFKLDPSLFGFEMVVASSNNGAVENITLELPQRNTIDACWLPDGEHFAEEGRLVAATESWGLISGALGSKKRRTAFVNRYYKGEPPFGMPIGPATESHATVAAAGVEGKLPLKPGLRHRLSGYAAANAARDASERERLWQAAVAEYNSAKALARERSEDCRHVPQMVRGIVRLRQERVLRQDARNAVEQQFRMLGEELAALDAGEARIASARRLQSDQAMQEHLKAEPGLWLNLKTLWGARRRWERAGRVVVETNIAAIAEFDRIQRITARLQAQLGSHQLQLQACDREIESLTAELERCCENLRALAAQHRAIHLQEWLDHGNFGEADVFEKEAPWLIEGWRKARANVFLQALKLHRTFFELEASRVRSNLELANGLLAGKRFKSVSRQAIRSAWATLFMAVPVLSSTFASFARSFSSLRAGEIGWLLVDEAGQATPQAAVGALWRARRAVMVGDPLQLKPILQVSDASLEHMRCHYGVDPHWLANRQSAQTLADAATPWGRLAGKGEDRLWLGLPLVVHRRCDLPMFTLANRIAYDGAMVYGTESPAREKETLASLDTGWLHVSGPSQGNWVPAEGRLLLGLIEQLRADGVSNEGIAVVTPFKAVRERLKGPGFNGIVAGTIHTMQGKEAQVVILVLGGSSQGGGARDWAVSEPNLLNVAATRARRRLYVIGDRSDWQRRSLFCDVMDLLPERSLTIGAEASLPASVFDS